MDLMTSNVLQARPDENFLQHSFAVPLRVPAGLHSVGRFLHW